MKLLYTSLFLIITSKSFSQIYHPLPLENVIWEENEYFTTFHFFDQTWSIHYTDGDTIIYFQLYKKLYYESNEIETSTSGGITQLEKIVLKTYEGALRQDTSNKKVFMISAGDNNENVLYDFDLEVGDSIFMMGSYLDDIDSIDSVLVNGSYHKRMWYFLEYPDGSAVIEGVGNNRGLISPIFKPYVPWYKEIKCVSVDAIHIYGTNDTCCQPGDTCGTILPPELVMPPDATDDTTNTGITFNISSLYSLGGGYQDHPLNVYIHHPSDNPLKLVMYNLLGKILMSRIVSPHQSFILSHVGYSSGIYLFSLFDGNRLVETKKLFWQ